MKKRLACLLVLLACSSGWAGVDCNRPEDIKFFYSSTTEQIENFKLLDFEAQYRLYIFGNQCMHPPAIHLAGAFAEGGAAAVQFLKPRLQSASDEPTIRDIALVFSWMKGTGRFDFSTDPQLVKLLNAKVAGMNGIWKKTAADSIAGIGSAAASGEASPGK